MSPEQLPFLTARMDPESLVLFAEPQHPICAGASFERQGFCSFHAAQHAFKVSAKGQRWLDEALASDGRPWDVPALRAVMREASEGEADDVAGEEFAAAAPGSSAR